MRERIAVRKIRPDGRNDDGDPADHDRGRPPPAHATARACSPAARPRSSASPPSARSRRRCGWTPSGSETQKFYLHHYNFPPFSVGEAGFMRGPKRRDIGHGALAERALVPVVPTTEEFPYTIRVVSDIARVQRLVVDGLGLRLDARADGRRRADQGAGRRHRHGADQGGRRLRRAHRHRRRRGPPRRHGLQGRRHRGGHHRPPDGHQDHGRHVRDHARRADAGQRGPRCSSSAR